MLAIEIPLRPVPWAAPIKVRKPFKDRKTEKKRYFADPKCKEKSAFSLFIQTQRPPSPITEYTVLTFKFTFSPPQSASKNQRAAMIAGEIIPTHCDCTNLQKLAEDCLKGIVIDDDRKVAKIFSEKLYGEKDSVLIRVFTLKEYLDAHS